MIQCGRCGNWIPENAECCPTCGRLAIKSESLGNVHIFVLIYGLIAAGCGILLLCFVLFMFDEFWSTISGSNGLYAGVMTYGEARSTLVVMTGALSASGVLAVASALLAWRLVMNSLSAVLCVVASVLLFFWSPPFADVETLFTTAMFIIGLYMAYRIHKAKSDFRS